MSGVESRYGGFLMVKVTTPTELLQAIDAIHTQAMDAELSPRRLRALEVAMKEIRPVTELRKRNKPS